MSISIAWRSAGEGGAIFASILIDLDQRLVINRPATNFFPLCLLSVLSDRCAGRRARTATRVNG